MKFVGIKTKDKAAKIRWYSQQITNYELLKKDLCPSTLEGYTGLSPAHYSEFRKELYRLRNTHPPKEKQ